MVTKLDYIVQITKNIIIMDNKKSTTNTNYPRLLKVFKEEISSNLIKQNNFTSPMQVPRILKIVLNMGVGQAVNDKKILEKALGDMEKIAGQKPIPTRAKNSVAGFKIRKGYAIGCKVTLRGKRMYEFLDRLISIALPRVRDFRGLVLNSMVEVIIILVLRSKLFFQKLITIK